MATKKAKKAVKKAARKPAKKKTAKPAAKKVAAKKVAAKKTPTPAPVTPKGTTINPYLTFNGNCEEAFNFYKQVFGGKFSYLGRFKEMPPAENQPPVQESEGDKIMHVSLPISKETILMGSDSSEALGQATMPGNNFSVSISAPSTQKADVLFKGLSSGGQVTMPMNKTFWGSYFGMLKDRFGIQWMISFDAAPSNN
jgi:PhnB protein